VIALIAGGVACRTTGSDRLSGPLVCCLIGIAGLFGSQLLFFQLNLATYFEAIAAIRMVVDVCAAYLISLFIAALISAIDPS
jgi:uncharacterized membrane protein YeaQ/YmgE (transglycosylase-associated protein family)